MSTNTFAPVAFPALRATADGSTDSTRAAGYAAGYAEGARVARDELDRLAREQQAEHDAVLREAREQADAALAALNAALSATLNSALPVLAEAHDSLAHSALDLATAVIGRELDDDERSAASVVARVLAHSEIDAAVSIRVSRDDFVALEPTLRDRVSASLVVDASLSRGDAIVEFENGFLDARIASALDRARGALSGEAK